MASPKEVNVGKGKMVAMILVLALLLGGGGLSVYLLMAVGKVKPDSKDEKDTEVKVEKAQIIELKSMVVNLRGTRGTRYLKARIGLETRAEKVAEELNEKSVRLKDFLIGRLSNVQITEIDTSVDRNRLKRELKDGINDLLESGLVTKVYFSEFIIQ